MTPVPFVDLERLHRPLRREIDAAVAAVLDRGDFILGGAVASFESRFAAYCGTAEAVGVGSGLDALTLTLRALGVGPGDEVITAANTFIATVNAISAVGAEPVLVDCLDATLCIDPERAAAAVTSRTRAILPVHLFGRLADTEALTAIAGPRDLALIEDAAQAHGARDAGRSAGAIGRAGCFSFYPAKNLGAFGDGGAVTTGDLDLARKLRSLRSYGEAGKNRHEHIGVNSRLDTLQAAVLELKLAHLDRWNEQRRVAAERYRERLAGLPAKIPAPAPQRTAHVHHVFAVRVADRDRVRGELDRREIQTGIHYPLPVHLQPAYAHLGRGRGSFAVAERSSGELLSLPLFPGITDPEIDRVCDALEQILT